MKLLGYLSFAVALFFVAVGALTLNLGLAMLGVGILIVGTALLGVVDSRRRQAHTAAEKREAAKPQKHKVIVDVVDYRTGEVKQGVHFE